MQITKEKNLILLTTSQKTYRVDINTGEFIGVRGKPILKMPSEVAHNLPRNSDTNHNLILALDRIFYSYNYSSCCETRAKILQTAEVLDYAGIKSNNYFLNGYEVVLKYKKEFFDWIKKDENEALFINNPAKFLEYIDELKYSSLVQIFESYNLKDHFPFYKSTFNNYLTAEHCSFFCYFCETTDVAKFLKTMGYVSNDHLVIRTIKTYFEDCKLLQKKLEKTKSFAREFVETRKLAELKKNEKDNAQLKEIAEKRKDLLFFENEQYTTIIPTTVNDFVEEGEKQKNCVGGYIKDVIGGRCYVVFIRNKNNINEPLITCEINPTSKRIVQFLTKCNIRPTSAEMLEFRDCYQYHLSNKTE
jgi:hypothetical protein